MNAAWLKAWHANTAGELDCEPLAWMIRATGDETGSRVQTEQIRQAAAVDGEHPIDASAAVEVPEDARGQSRNEQEFSRIAA